MGEPLKIDPSALSHVGIRGMRWGVRRGHNAGPGHTHHDEVKELLKKGSAKQLSNEELAKVNKRLQLEKTYSELTTKKKQKGKGAVSNILGIGKQAESAYNLATGPMGQYAVRKNKTAARIAKVLAAPAVRP